MKIELDVRRDLNENAAVYYDEAKKLREKAKGAEKALEETRRQLAELEKKIAKFEGKEKSKIRVKRNNEWFEKFRWFFSSDGFLVIAGRDAGQNDLVFSKYCVEGDLFLHADIQGGAATVIKQGVTAPERTLEEAAQFAASYSNAWRIGNAAVDVYAVKKEQVGKKSMSGFIGRGAFAIAGERKWFKGTGLGVLVGVSASGVVCAPEKAGSARFDKFVSLTPGGRKEKGELAKELAKKFECEIDELLQVLPNGTSKVN
ncbi:DUF814 domain-containing protein [Candidatus Micrarchaeota archaeon]|nr:DUF814 domain-containing protein [Candidatus Micrarchaeota archaeon]